MAYQLQITPSVGKRWTYVLEKMLVRIGRAKHCEVVVNDQLVSREHCQIQLMAEGAVFRGFKQRQRNPAERSAHNPGLTSSWR